MKLKRVGERMRERVRSKKDECVYHAVKTKDVDRGLRCRLICMNSDVRLIGTVAEGG